MAYILYHKVKELWAVKERADTKLSTVNQQHCLCLCDALSTSCMNNVKQLSVDNFEVHLVCT